MFVYMHSVIIFSFIPITCKMLILCPPVFTGPSNFDRIQCWVALHGMAHNFIELDKAVVHVIRLVSFL